MIHICQSCFKPIEDGDEVTFLTTGVYHRVPHISRFAVERQGMEIDPETLLHKECRLGHDGD